MKEKIAHLLSEETNLSEEEIKILIEIPPKNLGDFAFPCFILSKTMKKSPDLIARELSEKLKSSDFEKIEARGPYLNFFVNSRFFAEEVIKKILKERDNYGSSKIGKGKKVVIDLSSPNIAKPFGIGHLRSTIIGNAISKIYDFLGYKTIKINYLGDWGTPFGKIIAAYKKEGNEKKLKKEPVKYLYELYIKASEEPSFDEIGRAYFKELEYGNKNLVSLWKRFRKESINYFKKIYTLLNVEFDVYSGESFYNKKAEQVIKELEHKKLLQRSNDALIVDLKKYGLGIGLIQKADGTTLYLTRDIATAIDREKKYKFAQMIYEVGSEQSLHFKQLFKILELMGYKWALNCIHLSHGLYLDKDGKKFSTRKGKTIFMEDILNETRHLAKSEIQKREKLTEKELEERALAITRAAILYGDLKNFRENNIVFDIKKFISFEGNTGPYLLYSYARARSILRKVNYSPKKNLSIRTISPQEKKLITLLSQFNEIIMHAYYNLSPNILANYSFELSQTFNEFYHSEKVIGSDSEQFKLMLVDAFSQVLKNALHLLGITILEQM